MRVPRAGSSKDGTCQGPASGEDARAGLNLCVGTIRGRLQARGPKVWYHRCLLGAQMYRLSPPGVR